METCAKGMVWTRTLHQLGIAFLVIMCIPCCQTPFLCQMFALTLFNCVPATKLCSFYYYFLLISLFQPHEFLHALLCLCTLPPESLLSNCPIPLHVIELRQWNGKWLVDVIAILRERFPEAVEDNNANSFGVFYYQIGSTTRYKQTNKCQCFICAMRNFHNQVHVNASQNGNKLWSICTLGINCLFI